MNPKMMTMTEVEAAFAERRALVDAALDAVLPMPGESDPGSLREAMRYAVLQGGKRVRPLLTLAACEAAGGSLDQAMPAACAVELIHAYSLVHDDLPAMDNDTERRGKPTVHVAFGEGNAILVGDALLTLAFEILARSQRKNPQARTAEAVVALARHAGISGMVGGQALDLQVGQSVHDLATLEHVHSLKTGGLYAASGAMGALLAGAGDPVVQGMERWGLAFGIAFQHADDVLDDDQSALRDRAMERVDALVDECLTLAAAHGERGSSLVALARWIRHRVDAALRGEPQD